MELADAIADCRRPVKVVSSGNWHLACKRYITEGDILVLLSRLRPELWTRLRDVFLDGDSRTVRRLGYVRRRGRRDIVLCSYLPERVSLSRYFPLGRSPRTFGAVRGAHWPELAVRRFLLYDVFLHELGHLQIVRPNARRMDFRFASETLAQRFADDWRKRLWAEHFDHPDPVHNRPTAAEFMTVDTSISR